MFLTSFFSDLPGPVLDVLKFFVSPKNLHDMTTALNQCGKKYYFLEPFKSNSDSLMTEKP